MWHDIAQFLASHRSGVIDSLLAAALLAGLGSVAGVLRIRTRRASSSASARKLAVVRDIYTGKSGWAPANGEQPRIMVAGNYLVSNMADHAMLLARVEAK